MRKDVLVSSVRKAIMQQSSATQDSLKFTHPRVVEDEVAKAYDELLKTFYAQSVNLINAELDFYAKKYRLSIKKDTDGVSYVEMPAKPINLKSNLGLRYVRPVKGKFSFVRTNDTEIESIRNLEISKCSNHVFYYMDGKNIMLEFTTAEHELIEQVDVKLLPGFTDFDDEDEIDFPVGANTATNMILKTMGYRPTDNTNDDIK